MESVSAANLTTATITTTIQQQQKKGLQNSRIFSSLNLEPRDELEEKIERNYQYIQQQTLHLSDKDAHDSLQRLLHTKEATYECIIQGLFAQIVINEDETSAISANPPATVITSASKAYGNLTLLSQDGHQTLLAILNTIIADKFQKITDRGRTQICWLVSQLLKHQITSSSTGIDAILWNLMRHASGGDLTSRNLSFIENLCDLLGENYQYLSAKFATLTPQILYTFLRLLEDHNNLTSTNLKYKELNLVLMILRMNFNDCLVIGRDLVRLLQNLVKIPEVEAFWRDHLPHAVVLRLLSTRTSRRFLQSRLTPEMERKLVFLTSQVRFGNHKRYQDWFQRQYLATAESQTLRPDIIRFLVGVIHPTNELLCSDIIPRWAIIGWLLTTCTSPVAIANSKLALFYDWLFYDTAAGDNIMNIEPAILVIQNSMRSHPAVTATLLDFLCRIIPNFWPQEAEKVRLGIHTSLRQILEKRVIASLVAVFENAKLDGELRGLVRETFKEFLVVSAAPSVVHQQQTLQVAQQPEIAFSDDDDDDNNNNNNSSNSNNNGDNSEQQQQQHNELDEAKQIDLLEDDDDVPLSKVRLFCGVSERRAKLTEFVERMRAESDAVQICRTADSLIEYLNEELDAVSDDVRTLIEYLARILTPLLLKQHTLHFDEIFNANSTVNETLLYASSVNTPLFTLFRAIYARKVKASASVLYRLLAECRKIEPSIGYLLLYYLKVRIRSETKRDEDQTKASALKCAIYRDLCKLDAEQRTLHDHLLADLCNLSEAPNARLMLWLIPDIFRDFKQETVNNAEIVRTIVAAIDAKQLQVLIGKILQGHLAMFENSNTNVDLIALMRASLDWESIEQLFFWQLMHAHDVTVDTVLPLLSHLSYDRHPEALSALTLMLKQERPSAEFFRAIFARNLTSLETHSDHMFIFTLVKYWCDEYIDKVAELIAQLLSTKRMRNNNVNNSGASAVGTSGDQSGSGGGGGGGSEGGSMPASMVLVLGHLDQLRVVCERHDCMALFTLDPLQRALASTQSHASDTQRKQFSRLFGLVEGGTKDSGGGGGGSGGGRESGSGGGSGGSVKSSRGRKVVNNSSNSNTSSTSASNQGTSTRESSSSSKGKKRSAAAASSSSSSSSRDHHPPTSSSSSTSSSSHHHHHHHNQQQQSSSHHHHHHQHQSHAHQATSADETSEEEEIFSRQSRKRKKVVYDDDSD